MVDHVMRGPIMVMDSLPFGGDNDGTLPTEPEHWLESAPMQELLQKECVAAKLAEEATDPPARLAKATPAPGPSEAQLMTGFH